MGWTKAPADENLCTVIGTSYEVENARLDSPNAIEVVHGHSGEEDLDNMVFTQTSEGYKVDEGQFEETSNAERISKENKLPADDKELI